MRKLCLYITILLLMGCSHNNTLKKMESSKTITDIFNKAEIKDLAVIVDFFNAQICGAEKNEKITITQCYQRLFEWMEETEVTGGFIDIRIPYREQQKMYSLLSDSTFYQIWRIDHRLYIVEIYDADTINDAYTIEAKDLVYVGKYLTFLKTFGQENSVVKRCYNNLVQSGDYPLACMDLILSEYEQLDIKDVRTQFFLAMNFLTLNDALQDSRKFLRDAVYKNFYYSPGSLSKASKELKE